MAGAQEVRLFAPVDGIMLAANQDDAVLGEFFPACSVVQMSPRVDHVIRSQTLATVQHLGCKIPSVDTHISHPLHAEVGCNRGRLLGDLLTLL